MNHTRHSLLLILQIIIIVGLIILDMNHDGADMRRWALFAVLLMTTGLLFLMGVRSRHTLRNMVAELRRATNGNWKTRLLAREDVIWNEVVFSINEVIEQLENVQITAIKSQTARRNLLSSISHDIRTPLTSIIGYIDAMKDGIAVSEQEKQEYLAILAVKSNRLKEMIDELFTMAKLDADELPHKEEVLDFAEMARKSLIDFLPELKKYEVKLQVDLPEQPHPILADRLSLMRIIGNIMKNAVNYGKEGGVIGVELRETARDYELLIWDRGSGISQADLANVFERNFRSDQARKSVNGGSGLGLAIAKALVEKNGGRIWVESVPWEKTTFGFSIRKHTRQTVLRNS